MKLGAFLALACLGSLAASSAAWAETLRVGPHAPFKTVTAALEALPSEGGALELAPGEYREKIIITKPNVRLIGQGRHPQDVVLVWSDSALTAGGTSKSYSVAVSGDGFRARNLTIQNDYHLKDSRRSQAVALYLTADRAVLENVRLLGAQDTLYAASKKDKPSRQYFKNCYVEGHVDFIFGDAKAFFDRCQIHGIANDNVLFTAQSKNRPDQDSAYVFDRCVITAAPEAKDIFLGRAWRPFATVVFLRTRIEAKVNAAGWREWTPGMTDTLATAYFAEFASTGPGAAPDQRDPRTHQLTDEESKVWRRERFLAGPDGWRP